MVSLEKKLSVILERKTFIKKYEKIKEFYDVETRPLSTGTYGAVHKCTHKITHLERAVKIIPKYKLQNVEEFINEIEIMKLVDHPNIIRIFEWFEDKANVFLVMELCTGGELYDRITQIGNFREKDAASIFKQMMNAVNYCYKKGICHKDLKPENFMFSDKSSTLNLKLIDFGLSQIFHDPKIGNIIMTRRVGTPFYIAPEVIQGVYNSLCDVWSMGVILYVLICGAPPFNGANDIEILQSVERQKFSYNLAIWGSISADCKDLINKMLCPAKVRLTPQQVIDHPWLKNAVIETPQAALTQIVTDNLKTFRGAEKVKQAVLTYMATQLSDKELQSLKWMFIDMDKNGDGILSLEEIELGLKGKTNESELKAIMYSLDTDHSGFIEYNEFIAAAVGEDIYLNSDKLSQAFQMFDKDRNGKIDISELRDSIGGELKGINPDTWEKMIKAADLNGDGTIDYEEFSKMMNSLSSSRKVHKMTSTYEIN